MTHTLKRLPQIVQDAAFALALTVVGCMGLLIPRSLSFGDGGHGPRQLDHAALTRLSAQPPTATPFGPGGTPSPWAYVVTALAFLPLVWRRRYPLTILGVTTLAAVVYEVGHFPPNIAWLAPLVALYTVASLRDRRVVIVAGVLSAAAQLGAAWFAVGSTGLLAESVRIIALLGVAGAMGDATRNRRAYVAEVEQRAADAERTRDEEARRRVDEERLHIARELHDITAHSLSIIAVQSGAAAHVIDSNPAEARKALDAIRRTSRDALDELRAMLGVLRAGEEGDAPLAPAPGLARLADLIAPLTEAGYKVESHVDADLGEIPAVVEGSAYRIVQESLTNVVRHAGICNVMLCIRREEGALSITIDDDGNTPPTPVPAGGHGLAGMRERVTALRGTFEAAPMPGGGFHVAARLPIVRSTT
ncbi:MAG: sensor histidine kinase [Coriobacteriia bacterium]|nr:sensor histidine kinase [Coriobacteriia bacterium]